jgi:hypothetical protein
MRIDGYVSASGTLENNSTEVLSKLKPGDTIRAQVIDNSGNELTLKLSDGSKVSASAMSPVDAADGEYVNFVYKGTIDGKPALEVAGQKAQPQVDTSLENIKNSLTALSLPVTEKNIELAQALKGQNVPITADSMSKMLNLVYTNTEMKPDTAAFLTAANMSNDQNNIENLQNLLAGRLKISNDIGDLLKLINGNNNNQATAAESADVNNILQRLSVQIASKGINQINISENLNKSSAVLNGTINNTADAGIIAKQTGGISDLTGNVNINYGSSNLNINETLNNNSAVNNTAAASSNQADKNASAAANAQNVSEPQNTEQKATAGNTASINTGDEAKTNNSSAASDSSVKVNININDNAANSGVKAGADNNLSNIIEQISNKFKGGMPLSKTDLSLLSSLNSELEAMLGKGNLSADEQSTIKMIAKEINIEIFKIQKEEAQSDNVSSKSIKSFVDAVNGLKNLYVKVNQNTEEIINPVKLYKDMDNALQTLKSSILRLPASMHETAMNIVNNLESNLNFINQLNNYSSYVQIPLSIFNQNTTGELYMLKKGSKSRKLDPSNITVLISLDSNNIGRIDTLLSIDKKNISTNFRLENSDVFGVLKENHKELYTSLLEKGYRLVDFTYRLMDEPISIVNFETEAKKEFIKSSNKIDVVI